jgi:hypothetical protein
MQKCQAGLLATRIILRTNLPSLLSQTSGRAVGHIWFFVTGYSGGPAPDLHGIPS